MDTDTEADTVKVTSWPRSWSRADMDTWTWTWTWTLTLTQT